MGSYYICISFSLSKNIFYIQIPPTSVDVAFRLELKRPQDKEDAVPDPIDTCRM